MYAREVGDRTLTLGVSGKLWHRSLVMYDVETESLWSHILGEALEGELKGTRLRQIPCAMTTWKSWQRSHPETTVVVMSRTAHRFTPRFYQQPKFFVLGIAAGDRAKAWSFQTLSERRVINDTWLEQPVVVMYEQESATARLYESRVGQHDLIFFLRSRDEETDVVFDQETGSTWDLISGVATAGPLEGQRLTPMPAIVSLTAKWLKFHPESERK